CDCAHRQIVFRLSSLLWYCHGAHRALHSFPTRRSSDLGALCSACCAMYLAETPGSSFLGSRYRVLSCWRRLGFWKWPIARPTGQDRKSTRLNSSHVKISYAVFCLKKKKNNKKHGR